MRLAERVTLASIVGALAIAACDFGINLRGLTDGGSNIPDSMPFDVAPDGFVPPMPAVEIAAGGAHTCAVRVDGTITCWGAGGDGRLGNGAYVDSSFPVLVQGVNDAAHVTAGSNHTCAVEKTGRAICWGNNVNGQLGDGSTSRSPTPVPVMNANDMVAISAGSAFTCAIRADSQVYCWGQTGEQLGFPNVINQPVISIPVQGLTDVAEVEAGANHACARNGSGEVYCWGSNSQGQLGQADAGSASDIPLKVDLPGKAVSVSAGSTHSCAVIDLTTTYCWGSNASGQLGNGSVASSPIPTKVVPGPNDFLGVAAGTNHTCGVRQTGGVACWGSNVAGQLGTGDTMMSTIPVTTMVTSAKRVVSGASHSCALGMTGTIKCWGHNGNGRIGVGTRVGSSSPVAVGSLSDISELAVGGDHSCARQAEAGILCWGDNGAGQVGVATGTLAATSVPMASNAQNLVALVAGGANTCGMNDGGAFCWGLDSSGQLGNGTYTTSHNPVRFGAQAPFPTKSIAVGSLHGCAVTIDGGLALCAGNNGSNQLGTGGAPATSPNPLQVLRGDAGLSGVTKLWAGTTNACAQTNANELLCWGLNTSAQAGNGNKQSTSTATLAMAWTFQPPAYIGFGVAHACALRTDGKVLCWGAGSLGQLGDSTGMDRSVPVYVQNSSLVTQLAVGSNHACALLGGGVVECWGSGSLGQIGNGDTKNQPAPKVLTGFAATAIAAGGDNTCAVLTDRSVVCWGPNADGQLGDGTPTIFPLPTSVKGY